VDVQDIGGREREGEEGEGGGGGGEGEGEGESFGEEYVPSLCRVQCSAVECGGVRWSAVRWSAVQCSAVLAGNVCVWSSRGRASTVVNISSRLAGSLTFQSRVV
jgi:hypothetical protein